MFATNSATTIEETISDVVVRPDVKFDMTLTNTLCKDTDNDPIHYELTGAPSWVTVLPKVDTTKDISGIPG